MFSSNCCFLTHIQILQEEYIKASGPITSWQIDVETVETVAHLIFLGSKITADGIAAMKLKQQQQQQKHTHSLEEKLWPT